MAYNLMTPTENTPVPLPSALPVDEPRPEPVKRAPRRKKPEPPAVEEQTLPFGDE